MTTEKMKEFAAILAPLVVDEMDRRLAARQAAYQEAKRTRHTTPLAMTEERWRKEVAPKVWAEWHLRALRPVTDPRGEIRYIRRIVRTVWCGKCKRHFKEWLMKNPADFGDPKFDYFHYTWRAHNAASEDAGTPMMSLAEARGHWGIINSRGE